MLMAITKFYLLYNDEKQSKLLTTASSEENVNSETLYYTEGVWFEYDQREASNHLFNEKKMKGIKFPAEAKLRVVKNFGSEKKESFKWVA